MIRNTILGSVFMVLAPDTGGGTGGAEQGADNAAELEALKAQLKEANDKAAALEKEKADAAKEKMTEAEKKKAEAEELEKMKAATINDYKLTQVQKAGLAEEYAALITGNTQDEIKASGELLAKLVGDIRKETEADVKKTLANTGAPGAGDSPEEMDEQAFLESLYR